MRWRGPEVLKEEEAESANELPLGVLVEKKLAGYRKLSFGYGCPWQGKVSPKTVLELENHPFGLVSLVPVWPAALRVE
jgi:hypothetical protein